MHVGAVGVTLDESVQQQHCSAFKLPHTVETLRYTSYHVRSAAELDTLYVRTKQVQGEINAHAEFERTATILYICLIFRKKFQ